MKIGTKSLLFGAHQFILHPLLVLIAWKKLYGSVTWKELTCIIIHDWGYWGCPNMDGPEGEAHPYRPALWAYKHFRHECYYNLIAYHSRFSAKTDKMPVSRLCLADKYGTAMYPTWLWVLLCTLSGEVKEYMPQKHRYEILKSGPSGGKYQNPFDFFNSYKSIARKWVEHRDVTIGKYKP